MRGESNAAVSMPQRESADERARRIMQAEETANDNKIGDEFVAEGAQKYAQENLPENPDMSEAQVTLILDVSLEELQAILEKAQRGEQLPFKAEEFHFAAGWVNQAIDKGVMDIHQGGGHKANVPIDLNALDRRAKLLTAIYNATDASLA